MLNYHKLEKTVQLFNARQTPRVKEVNLYLRYGYN